MIMKKSLLIIGVGAAFLAVSLWVWLSNGKSARAVKAKFQLGGALLTLTGMMTVGACNSNNLVSCYDPVSTDVVYIEREGAYDEAQDVKNGDQIKIKVSYFSAYGVKVTIAKDAQNEEVLHSQVYKITESNTDVIHTIDVGDHVGEAHLRVYVMTSEEQGYECEYMKLNVLK